MPAYRALHGSQNLSCVNRLLMYEYMPHVCSVCFADRHP
jgi:hypothetical protein